MCLHTLDFGLTWDKDLQLYTGYGYKALNRNHREFNKWLEAYGNSNYSRDNHYGITKDSTDSNKSYHAGFHIFLKEKDACDYMEISRSTYSAQQCSTYEVVFHDVIGFGSNESGDGYGRTIIARYMYVHDTPLRDKYGVLQYDLGAK